jgi:hypothetical protein
MKMDGENEGTTEHEKGHGNKKGSWRWNDWDWHDEEDYF